ncbi:MAG: membrane protein insertion efficiency factor YidD [Sandaracinaceae bacterium]|nr:membrane protein insertion efficiency factor YidD [Sandaracinaceae bacterium]
MIAKLLQLVIRFYWWTLSPVMGSVCRFQPSCSRYTAVCIDRFGPLRGSWMGFVRICKCQPFHPGGYDAPPLRPGSESTARGGFPLGQEPTRPTARTAGLPGLSPLPATPSPEKSTSDVHPAQDSSNLAPPDRASA